MKPNAHRIVQFLIAAIYVLAFAAVLLDVFFWRPG